MNTTRKINRPRTQAIRRAVIDALEPRRMLAVFNGTSGNDIIDIFNFAGGGMNVRINGSDNITTDPSITINAGVGNDTFNVSSSRSGTTITARGDSGNDKLVNPSVLDLDAVYVADFRFEGGTGTDLIVADNGNDTTTPYEMMIATTRIDKAIPFGSVRLLFYTTVELLEYWDSNGSNQISFFGMETPSANITLAIHGNGGNDTISTGGFWSNNVGMGGVFVEGGTGADALLLSNLDSGANTYVFNTNTIDVRSSAGSEGVLSYFNCETIDFVSDSSSNDQVNLFSKLSGTSLKFDSRAGNDTFRVGGGDLDSNGFLVSNTTFLGGPGADSIITDDTLDRDAAGETEVYTWNATTLAKGSAGFTFSEFESQALVAANGINAGQFNTVPRVDLNATAVGMASTTVTGGAARMCSVSVGNGNLGAINGALFLNLGGGALDTVNINTQGTTGDVLYRLDATQLLLPRVVNYSGVKFFNINAGSGNDSFFIDGAPTGMAVQVNAASGNDTVTVATGNVDANLLGPVTFNGAAGANTAVVNNTTDNSPESQTLNGLTFIDGLSHTFNGVSDLRINNGPGGTVLAVNSVSVRTSINGGSASDHFDVGGGDIDANIVPSTATFALLLIDGNGGNDSIRFNDFNDDVANSDTYTFQQTNGIDQLRRFDTTDVFISWVDIEGVTLDQSNAPQVGNLNSFTTVNQIDTPVRINGNGGLDQIAVNDAAMPVFVHTGLGDRDNLFIDDGDAIPAIVVIDQSDDIENFRINSGGTLRLGSGVVLAKTRLGLNPELTINGVLDLAGGALISRAGGPAPATFQTLLTRGYNGGAWNGTHAQGAINSSLAASSPQSDGVGYGLGSQIAVSTIGPFSIAAGDTLLTHALYGDANLDGTVNLADFNRLAANFGQSNKVWVEGDSNYDGTVNLADFNPLAGNFGQALAAGAFGNNSIRATENGEELRNLLEELT